MRILFKKLELQVDIPGIVLAVPMLLRKICIYDTAKNVKHYGGPPIKKRKQLPGQKLELKG
jgi:hypothetical protein